MASFRCIFFSSGVRIFSKNYPQRLTRNTFKSYDIGSGNPKIGSRGLFSSKNKNLLSTSQFNTTLQRRSFPYDLKLVRAFVPETTAYRYYSTDKSTDSNKNPDKDEANNESNLTVFQRFKKTYKEHGKVLVIVHCMTSVVWFGSFYTAAVSGVDIVPLMEYFGLSETIIKPFRAGGLGFVALAYLMYKLATPARYTVTLAGTNYAIKYLRKTGKMNPVPKGDNFRSLYADGKTELKERRELFQQRQRYQAEKFRKRRIMRRKDT